MSAIHFNILKLLNAIVIDVGTIVLLMRHPQAASGQNLPTVEKL